MAEEYIVWTKKLGQRHYAKADLFKEPFLASFLNQVHSETLCGMPMLGNNYAKVIPFDEQKECEECRKVMKDGMI